MQHLPMYMVNISMKYFITNRHIFPEKLSPIQGKLEKEGQEVFIIQNVSILTIWSLLVMKNVTN